ncbi:MAG: ABC transporter permease subunit [Firmicutes bacterium]|nr:ABC transporter permease subunit [Bacillota bacterium]
MRKNFDANLKELFKNRLLLLMFAPVFFYYVIFNYIPMFGLIIAFKDFRPYLGILGSPWIGFDNFRQFFKSFYFWALLRNTFVLNIYDLIFYFPMPIILALLLNEVKRKRFKTIIQTVSYIPHFISLVVIVGLIYDFFSTNGIINQIIGFLGIEPQRFLNTNKWYIPMFVGSTLWQNVGWGTIIYISALTSIDHALYEAAYIDGAGSFKKLIYITLPGIAPTIIILLILRIGHMMSVGFEKVLLLQNPGNIEVSEVISTYVYRKGLIEANYSFAAAVGLFNGIINFLLLYLVNMLSRKFSETSLW